jgi:Plavaka transposase
MDSKTPRNTSLAIQDVLPQALSPLPPNNASQHIVDPTALLRFFPDQNSESAASESSLTTRVTSRLCQIFTTPRNIFGLFRRYYSAEPPSHDPEERISMQDLSNIAAQADPLQPDSQTFFPYPNRSAFRLGDWFWNGGVQKSRASFHELVDIICDPVFQTSDIKDVKWDKINKDLADHEEWLDEDAGWKKSAVTILVPHEPRRKYPSKPDAGPRNFVVGDFYHRSLVSVIQEKLSSPNSSHLFHYEPHELVWQPPSSPDPIRVQGELYNSPAFIDCHRELQDSPGEPGCNLPRVVIALMFWSDVTHLTTFGNNSLWPLYLFFGNESKYRRCKPSCNMCEHVAYFQKVSGSANHRYHHSHIILATVAGCL